MIRDSTHLSSLRNKRPTFLMLLLISTCVVTYFWLFCWRNGYICLRRVNDAGSLKKTWSDWIWKQNHFGRNASEHNFLLTMEDFDNNIVEENSPITTLYQWSERFDGQHASLIANYLMDYYGDKKPFNCYVFSSDGFKFETHKASCIINVPIWHVTNLGFSVLYIGNTCRKQNVSIYNEKSQSGRWWNGDLYTFRQ